MLYSRTELKHLKYKLIEKDGLSEEEATARIKNLLEYTAPAQKKFKSRGVLRKK